MKKIILIIINISMLFSFKTKKVSSSNTNYYARSYVVIDSSTKQILESKDMNLQRSVASISKIMTALVALENGSLEQTIKVNEDILKGYGSSIYLQIGEEISLEDLLYGLMLRSGNDAAVTIARLVSGTIPLFVDLMNKKANEIGMINTLFNNPSGLDVDDEGNLSTSYDMALLMREAMQNEMFRKITGTKQYKSKNHGIWKNKNRLLKEYENTIGGKTGYTTKAKRTLVTSAKKDNTELIIVTLDCGGDFAMHKSLYEKYFSLYTTYELLNKGSNYFEEYELICDQNIKITLEKSKIKEYGIVYKINDNKGEIILVNNEENIIIDECSAIKRNSKTRKKWYQKIIDHFKS